MAFLKYLPAYELNRSPRVIVAFDTDFLRNLDAFRRALPKGLPFTVLLQTGWSLFVSDYAEELKRRALEAHELLPEGRIIFLLNEKSAIPILQGVAECIFCHHNAFLEPERYPLAGSQRDFDAIYVARITPFKRHALAAAVRNLYLIGTHSHSEEEYFQEIMHSVPYMRWEEKVFSWRIGGQIARSRCGLALSAVEGGMYVCGEYSLCGLPVVNTMNLGGRDAMLPEFSVFQAADTPEAVAEGVEYWKAHSVQPQEIREAFLKKASEHRERLEDLVASLAGKRVKLPHKLGVRCRLFPHQLLFHGIKAK